MDPSELHEYLGAYRAAAAKTAPGVANAIADQMENAVQYVLHSHSHAPGLFYKAEAGDSPSYVTGRLAKSINHTPASGEIRATSTVYASAVYAGIQEFGGWTWGNRGMMKWHNSGGRWFMNRVFVPEHPYFRPALERSIRDGSLSRAGVVSFARQMAPLWN
jgi:phage gpG-like protein